MINMKDYQIVQKKILNENVIKMDIYAPMVAKRCLAGQFVILRVDKFGERIPLTIADYDRDNGIVSIIFQIVGSTTTKLSFLQVGDCLEDFVGPLGKATEVEEYERVCVVGGGVGCAISLPVAKAFYETDAEVISIIGFRNKDIVILEDEFKQYSDYNYVMTDDGSYGEKGFVTNKLEEVLSSKQVDKVYAIGPIMMMKNVVKVAMKYNVPSVVSLNPIMIDGTGLCGGCRVTVDGKVKFACVDGPEFDGALVDFDELLMRNRMYFEKERAHHEKTCNLLRGVVDEK